MIKETRHNFRDPEKKAAIHEKNEHHIEEIFRDSPAFWGIDSITLNICISDIDDDILFSMEEERNNNITVIRTSYSDQKDKDIYLRFTKIQIFIPTIGELIIDIGKKYPYTAYSRLQLIHGGINVSTLSADQIEPRFRDACKAFEVYGISIDPTFCSIHKVEIAFTFACNHLLPLAVRKFLLYSFSKSTSILSKKIYKYTSTPKDIHVLEAHKSGNQTYVLYDKTAKAESLGQISSKIHHKIRVYRLEISLMKKKVKDVFHSNNLTALSNNAVEIFIKNNIENALTYYKTKLRERSYNTARAWLREAHRINGNYYSTHFLHMIYQNENNTESPTIIDLETFVFMNLKNIFVRSNWSTRRKSLIRLFETNHDAYEKVPLERMDGWEVERIINLMFNTNNFGGYPICDTQGGVKFFPVSRGYFTNRTAYLQQLISSNKRNLQIDPENLISERTMHQWSDPQFILNTLEDRAYFSEQ